MKPRELRRVTVDTTVQDKAVTFPTDGKLLNRSRVRLVKLCRRHGVGLRQSYARKGPQALLRVAGEPGCRCAAGTVRSDACGRIWAG